MGSVPTCGPLRDHLRAPAWGQLLASQGPQPKCSPSYFVAKGLATSASRGEPRHNSKQCKRRDHRDRVTQGVIRANHPLAPRATQRLLATIVPACPGGSPTRAKVAPVPQGPGGGATNAHTRCTGCPVPIPQPPSKGFAIGPGLVPSCCPRQQAPLPLAHLCLAGGRHLLSASPP